jgi:hypothetical protein
MSDTNARAKASRSLTFAHHGALVTIAFGICGAWGLATGQQALSPAQGLIALIAGMLSGMAYRAANRWEALADTDEQKDTP